MARLAGKSNASCPCASHPHQLRRECTGTRRSMGDRRARSADAMGGHGASSSCERWWRSKPSQRLPLVSPHRVARGQEATAMGHRLLPHSPRRHHCAQHTCECSVGAGRDPYDRNAPVAGALHGHNEWDLNHGRTRCAQGIEQLRDRGNLDRLKPTVPPQEGAPRGRAGARGRPPAGVPRPASYRQPPSATSFPQTTNPATPLCARAKKECPSKRGTPSQLPEPCGRSPSGENCFRRAY